MKLMLLTVGKIKDRQMYTIANRYIERSCQFAPLKWETVSEFSTRGNVERAKQKETENLRKVLKQRDFVVLLDEKGKTMSSTGLSRFLSDSMSNTPGRIVFIIGGAYGVCSSLHERADMLLSLSRMTFPHELCTVFLAEQLYRALSIIAGSSYHH